MTLSAISYPADGNDLYFEIEEFSYWFAHRNRCIIELMRQFPPAGTIYDIGGGNGFVSVGLQKAGFETVLVEVGTGAVNAKKRGLKNVVQGTLAETGLAPGAMDAAGAFDVVEHIQDDIAFLREIHCFLRPGGRFYCAVPAEKWLWSDEDVHAGHFRRYDKKSLTLVMEQAGFEVEFISGIFSWLVGPLFLLKTLLFRFRKGKKVMVKNIEAVKADHRLPAAIYAIVGVVNKWELSRLMEKRPIPFGSSLLCVAQSRITKKQN